MIDDSTRATVEEKRTTMPNQQNSTDSLKFENKKLDKKCEINQGFPIKFAKSKDTISDDRMNKSSEKRSGIAQQQHTTKE